MRVLTTGPYGNCGTALIDHLYDCEKYEFTNLNRSDRPADHPYGNQETVVADITDYDDIRPAFENQDAVVHLAADPSPSAEWESILENNIIGMYNVLEAARDASVESFVFASSNHAVGMVEEKSAPDIYLPKSGIVVGHDAPPQPDSYYGVSKAFGESLGCYYAEHPDVNWPSRFYSLRICNVAGPDTDTPKEYAAHLKERGGDPDNETFRRKMNRKKAMWHSRRDFADLVKCCLDDRTVTFDVFNGVSGNQRRWFDLEHARTTIGYNPQDDGEKWNI